MVEEEDAGFAAEAAAAEAFETTSRAENEECVTSPLPSGSKLARVLANVSCWSVTDYIVSSDMRSQ